MDQRISLVTLGVTDLARARSFYEGLGWSGAQQPDEEVCFFKPPHGCYATPGMSILRHLS